MSLATLSLEAPKTFKKLGKKRSQLPGNGNKLLQNLSKVFPFLLAVALDFQFRRRIAQAELD